MAVKILRIGLALLLVVGGGFLSAADLNLSNSSTKTEWPTVAVNSAGQVMVVWTEWDGQGKIYYRTYQNGQWSAKSRAGIVNQWAWSNQLDVDSDGVFHLSYADGFGSTTRDIHYSSYTGSGWQAPEMLFYSPHNSAWNKMSVDSSNNEINVIWYHKYFEGGVSDVVAMRKPKGGVWPANYTNLSHRSSLESIHPAIRVRNRRAYAVWMEGGGSSGWALRFSEANNWSWTSPVSIVGVGYYPAMALDNQGGVHVAYGSRNGNFYIISRGSNGWSNRSVSGGFAPLQFGDIRYRGGYLAAAWVEDHNGTYYVTYANKKDGRGWTDPVRASSGDRLGDGNKHVQLAVDDQGNAHIVWEGQGVGGREDIFYKKVQLFDPDLPFIQVDKLSVEIKTYESIPPAPKTIKIRNAGKGAMKYTLSTNRDWMTINPVSGSSSGENDTITISVDPGSRKAGVYEGSITISAPSADNSPKVVPVVLTVELPPDPFAPGDVKVSKLGHVGLMIKIYKNIISWRANKKNDGIFNIVNYRIWKRLKNSSSFELAGEVGSNVFSFTEGDFVSLADRDKWVYAVSCRDINGRESPKREPQAGSAVPEKNSSLILKNRIKK